MTRKIRKNFIISFCIKKFSAVSIIIFMAIFRLYEENVFPSLLKN